MEITEYKNLLKSEEAWFNQGRLRLFNHFLKKLSKRNLSILEIGCGMGTNVELLSNYGIVDGAEPAEIAISNCQKRFPNNNFFKKNIMELENEKKYDLICLFDVLEHIEDDLAALNKISDLLNDDGDILISVPAYMFMWSSHDENLHHYRRYTIPKIQEIVLQTDLDVKQSTYFNTLLFPIALLERKIVRNKLNKEYNAKNLPKFVDFIFKMILFIEVFVINLIRLPFGLTIMVHLKKREKKVA